MRSPARNALIVRIAVLGMVAAFTTGCAADVSLHGNLPPPTVMPQVKANLTKTDILTLLGTPSSIATFDNDTWYYMSHTVVRYAFFLPVDLDRKIVEIHFDKAGNVDSVRELGVNDGEKVAMDDHQTPAAGRELNLLQQLLGNVGKFSGASSNSHRGGGGGGGGGGDGGG